MKYIITSRPCPSDDVFNNITSGTFTGFLSLAEMLDHVQKLKGLGLWTVDHRAWSVRHGLDVGSSMCSLLVVACNRMINFLGREEADSLFRQLEEQAGKKPKGIQAAFRYWAYDRREPTSKEQRALAALLIGWLDVWMPV